VTALPQSNPYSDCPKVAYSVEKLGDPGVLLRLGFEAGIAWT
jgi:hypothetical protein